MSHWRYRLDRKIRVFAPELLGVEFENRWVKIANAYIEIAQSYAWDGCSPAWRIGGLWLGTWDGPRRADGRPVTWRASLVHDGLCQFRGQIPGLCKEATVALFNRLLQADGAPRCMVSAYTAGVDLLGPQDWAETQTLKGSTWPEPQG